MNQSELEASTCYWRQAREKRASASKSRLIGLSFTPDWSRSGARFFNQSQSEVKQTKAKQELLSTLNWKPLYGMNEKQQ